MQTSAPITNVIGLHAAATWKKHPSRIRPSWRTGEEIQSQSWVRNPEFIPHYKIIFFLPSQLQKCYHCFFQDLCNRGVWPDLKWWSDHLHAVKGIFYITLPQAGFEGIKRLAKLAHQPYIHGLHKFKKLSGAIKAGSQLDSS